MFIRILFCLIGLLTSILPVHADDSTAGPGIGFTYPIIAAEPEEMHGYRASLWYQPQAYIWSYVKLYFDASFGHWEVDEIPTYRPAERQINIYSVAPVARFYYRGDTMSPFIDMSIGLAYLTKTRMHTRNLGMHFSFQDQLAFGANLGKEQRVSLSFGAAHYSNGALCKRNSGMTIPLFINLGFRL